jgi:hypothetical protein
MQRRQDRFLRSLTKASKLTVLYKGNFWPDFHAKIFDQCFCLKPLPPQDTGGRKEIDIWLA